jgi:hypothetical protein
VACGWTTLLAWLAVAGVIRADEFVRVQGDQFVLNGQVYKIKGANYYPRDHMWAAMWSSWDPDAVAREARMMHDLGLNAVRILVPYSNGGWNGPNVPESRLQMLEQVVNTMGELGIRSVVTLFDWDTSFPTAGSSKETDHLKYLSTIVARLKDNPYVLMWDVKNEPDHPANYGQCDCNPGACGNWDCNPTKRNQIVSWLQRMCVAVRSRDPNHPVSAGMRWWENLSDVLAFEDVAVFHSYWPNIGTQEIPQTKALMGTSLKPILVEEWGWPTNPTPCNRDGQVIYAYNETEQLNVYTNHLAAFSQHNIAGGLQWMAFDALGYTSNADESFENYFGLWTYAYALKPAGIYYRDHFPVAWFPAVTPPTGPVTGLAATVAAPAIELSWTNPGSESFAGTMIRYSPQGYPASPAAGNLLCDRSATPGSTDHATHTAPGIGVRMYYSAFARNTDGVFAAAATANQMVTVRADYDGDGDVDMTDYAHIQACLSGPYIPQAAAACADTREDTDTDVDQDDVGLFLYCFGRPGSPLISGCTK